MSRRRRERRQTAAPKKASSVPGRSKTKGKKSLGWLGKGVLAALAIILLALLGGFLWAKSYLRSEEFRQQLAQQIGGAVKGKATVGEIEWQGSAMEVEELSLVSQTAGNWEVEDVSTKIDLGGIWNRTWLIPEIRMREARSEWDFRQKAGEENPPPMAQSPSAGKAASSRKESRFLPNRTEIHTARVDDYEGQVLTDGGNYQWQGMTLECEPRQQLSTLVTLTGGRLQTPHLGFESLALESADLAIRQEGIELARSEWTVDGMGSLSLTGGFEQGGRKLNASFEDWEFLQLLPPELAGFFEGTLTGGVLWISGAGGDKILAGVEVKDGVIQGVPFMNRLAAYAGSARLRKLTLEQASATIGKRGNRWEVKDLVLFDEGLLKVEGQLEVDGDQLAGRLYLGVPPGLLAHIPGAEEKVFLRESQGLLWTPVEISGTLKHPKEDLSERMIRAAGERMFEMIPETGVWALRYGAEAMDQSTALLLENQGLILEQGTRAAEEVFEQGSGVVEEGVKTGFGILNGILGGDRDE